MSARDGIGTPRRLAWAMGCAGAAGFVSLAWEILWLRIYAFATGGTLSYYGFFLGVYLAGIAVGSLYARHACSAASAGRVGRLGRAAGLVTAGATVVAYLHGPLAAFVAAYAPPLTTAVIAAVAGAMYGAVLPLVTHCAVPADGHTGRRVSYVYLANIVGSALGSTLTGFVFLDVLGVADTSAVLLLVSAGLAVALLLGGGVSRPRLRLAAWVAAVSLAPLALAGVLYGSLYERLLWKIPSAGEYPFAHLVENRVGVVAVTREGGVFGSGVYDGRVNTSLDDDRNLIHRAWAIPALHGGPRRVLMIGLGSGSWAQVVAHLPSVEELVVVEINPGYVETVGRYAPVRSLLTNPKVTVVVDDGRNWLARADGERFDVIVSNTTFHWRINVTHLLSEEFFELAASRLAKDGIVYFNTTHSDEAMRTACASFRSGVRFGSFLAAGNGAVGFDVERYRNAVRTYRVDGRPGAERPDAWLADNLPRVLDEDHLEPCPRVLARTEGVRSITDDNLASEGSLPWYGYFRFPPE